MNIREVIEKLHEMAERLPSGLDSEVQVHICNQAEPGLMTPSIEIDTMWVYNQDNVMTHGFAIVQGHPHRDEGSGKIEPMTAAIDDLARQWAADQAEGKSSKAEPIRVKTEDEEYMLLPFGSGTFVKLSFVDGVPLLPGAANAIAAGCICNPERNNYGRGRPYDDGVQMVVKDDCPVHPKVNDPTDPDSERDG